MPRRSKQIRRRRRLGAVGTEWRHRLRPNKPEENILKTLITFSGIKIIKNGNIKCFLELNLE